MYLQIANCVSFFAGGFFLPSGVFLGGKGRRGGGGGGGEEGILPGIMGLPNLFLFDPQALLEQVAGFNHV